jgi:allophanate hydrolase subunit 1
VPAARTLLLHLQPGEPDVAALAHALAQRDVSGPVEQDGPRIEIPVRYDGEDLAEVAALLGITRPS